MSFVHVSVESFLSYLVVILDTTVKHGNNLTEMCQKQFYLLKKNGDGETTPNMSI